MCCGTVATNQLGFLLWENNNIIRFWVSLCKSIRRQIFVAKFGSIQFQGQAHTLRYFDTHIRWNATSTHIHTLKLLHMEEERKTSETPQQQLIPRKSETTEWKPFSQDCVWDWEKTLQSSWCIWVRSAH